MKYDFALDFSPEGVRLLQGSGESSTVFGAVEFEDPFFETRLEDLRKEAEAVNGGPLATAILLPHSEVLFHRMKVEEGVEITEDKVRAELDGLTPYDLDDLAYDWKSLSKTQVEIAAVAKVTLAEADAFAAQNGFGPGPYSTPPNAKAFRGQPNFGASDRPMPAPEPAPEPLPAPAPVAEPAPEPLPAPVPDPAPEPVPAPPAVPAEKVPADKASASPSTADISTKDMIGEAQPASRAEPADASSPEARPAASKSAAERPSAPGAASAATARTAARTPTAGDAPSKPLEGKLLIDDYAEPQISRPPFRPAEPSSKSVPMGEGIVTRPGAPAPSTGAKDDSPSFSSRRGTSLLPAAGAAAAGAAAGVAVGAATGAAASRLGSIAARVASLPDGGAGPGDKPRPKGDAPRTSAGPVPPRRRPTAVKPSGRGAAPGSAAPTPTVRKVETPDSMAGAAKSLAASPASATPRPALSEAEALTVFGARNMQSSSSGGRTVIVAVVIALLLALAVWSAFFFLGRDPEPASEIEDSAAMPLAEPSADAPEIVAAPDPEPVDTTAQEVPAEVLPQSDTVTVTEDATADAPEPEPAAETTANAPEPAAEPQDPAVVPDPDDPLRRSQDAPETTRYAATGVSTDAPTGPATPSADTSELDANSMGDSTIRIQDGVARLDTPDLASLAAPAALTPPPPPGARFELDESGRVQATPEGALSPQGVRVTAGRPDIVPPPTPDRPQGTTESPAVVSEPAAELPEADVDIPVTDGQPTSIPPERPAEVAPDDEAAAGIVAPAARPVEVTRRAGFDDPDAPTTAGGVALSGLGGPQDTAEGVEQTPSDAQVVLAALTPRARPAIETPIEETPVEETAAEDAPAEARIPQITEEQSTAQAEAVAAAIASIVPGLENATDEAVARSLRPDQRPSDLARRAEQARAAQPVQVASAAATVTPRNPTTGSVADRATEQNVIALNRVNLIGVYGTQSDRRALIRLPSGRFVKVKVGDRVDGGRVSAIGSDRLQYVKGGRQVVLSIPAG